MTHELRSRRMAFRPPRPSDVSQIFDFLGDPVAMQFSDPSPDLDACRSKITTHEAQRPKIGFAPWAIRHVNSSQIIGWGGLYVDPFDDGWGLEVGYFFAPSAWRQGFATEMVRFCCDLLARQNWQGTLQGFSHPQNIASARILEKAGFTTTSFHEGMNRLVWNKDFYTNPRRA